MNRKYNLKLDLQFRCNNSIMKFNQFDNNTSDFFMRITNGGNLVDIEKAIVVLAIIKPSGKIASQFVEVENGLVYADLKPNMRDEIGTYTAQAMLILEDERVVTDVISYEVEEDKIFSLLNDTVETSEEFTLLTDMLNRLSTIEISEEQRVINEAERILSEENRKIEEAKRVEVELIRQHEEADRAKYDATRESNENIRKQNESIRLANETNRIDEEAKRVEEENKRKLAEEERNANYNFMTEDEERRRLEANAHKEAEVLRVQAETNRVNEEARRRTTEQARVSAENTRVNNENARKANETTRQTNETKRVEAETQRQNRYNSFIADAEAKEEERKSNELDRRTQETKRVSNEVERISNENTRKANEKAREKNETSRQYVFENKVNEIDKKIIELNTTKDNFVSSVTTKVDTKISELDNTKSDMTNTVSNKVNEIETRFNALTSSQQQDAEIIDARDGETSLKARLDRDIKETTKELDKIKKLEESTISTVTTESDFTTVEQTSNGYFEDVRLEGKTLVNLIDKYMFLHGGYTLNENMFFTGVANGTYLAVNDDVAKYKPSSTYTMIVEVVSNTLDGEFKPNIPHPISIFNESFTIPLNATGVFVKKLTTKASFEGCTTGLRAYILDTCKSGSVKARIGVLEGDHTQSPPSYFEGLKSVGDRADEVVVESVKGDGNLVEHIELNGVIVANGKDYTDSKYVRTNYITVEPNQTYYIKFPTNALYERCTVYFYGSSKSYLGYKSWLTSEFTTVANTKFIRIDMKKTDATPNTQDDINNCDFVVSKCKVSEYIPYQSNKKQLLYYNEETQAWEKPILREGDSIEKHADGKYYYHQRSGEVVLNGSENWNNDKNSSTISPETYRQSIQFDAIDIPSASFDTKTSPNIISDLLPTVVFGDVYSYNHIGISISGTDNIGTHIIINNNFIDVSELKQWLQANNLTLVYQLAQEKVYECTNIDLITYNGETNYIVNSGAITPRTTLKVHNNISNVVRILQEKVSLLESNVKASQEVQDMMILETDMRMLDIELALMDFMPMKLNLGGSDMLRSATYFNFLKNHIINETYEKEYLENVMNKYLATGRINQDEYDELYKMLYPPVYDIELPIEY